MTGDKTKSSPDSTISDMTCPGTNFPWHKEKRWRNCNCGKSACREEECALSCLVHSRVKHLGERVLFGIRLGCFQTKVNFSVERNGQAFCARRKELRMPSHRLLCVLPNRRGGIPLRSSRGHSIGVELLEWVVVMGVTLMAW